LGTVPGWTWDTPHTTWEQSFELLLQFVEREGHALVPIKHLEAGHQLGDWVAKQRQRHRTGHRELTPLRIERLEAVAGWSWNPLQDSWEQSYRALRQFAAREGHLRIRMDHIEEGVYVGRWMNSQRTAFRRGSLVDSRVRRLEAVPGWSWAPRSRSEAAKTSRPHGRLEAA
jgi:hypothetical protein